MGYLLPAPGGALRSPGRANAYFAAAVATGWLTAPLQQRFGLGGVAASQVLLFVLLPLLFNRGHTVRGTFRLRPVRTEVMAHSFLAGILAWVIAQATAAVTAVALQALGGRVSNPYAPLLMPGTPVWLLAVSMAALPAVAEEFAFRGLVLSGYRPLGPTASWVAAGLIFGLMHMSILRLPTLATLGMIFAYAVQQADSLVPGVVMHFTNNVLTLGAFLIVREKGVLVDTAVVSPASALFWLVLGTAAAPALYASLRALRDTRERPSPGTLARTDDPAEPPPGGLSPWPVRAIGGTEGGEERSDSYQSLRRAEELELRDPGTWLPLLLALPLVFPAMLAELRRAFDGG